MSELRSSVFSSSRSGFRRRRGPRPAAVVLVLLVALLVAELLGIWIHASRSLEPTTVPSLAVAPPGADEQLGSETLVVLTDTSEGDQVVVSVTIVQTHPDRDRPVALVMPRQLEVAAPGHGDLALGEVLAAGGPDLLVRAVQSYTGIDVEHIAVVDAAGIVDMAREQGGVDLCAIVAATTCKDSGPAVVHRRLTELDGSDEIAATGQQFAVVRAVVGKATGRLNMLLHPLRTLGTFSAAGRALLTDVDLGGRSALTWAGRVTAHDTATVDFITLPGFRDPDSGKVETFVEQAERVLQALRDGTTLPEEAFTAPGELSPSEVSVVVLNGSGINGLANQVADALTAAGFDVVEVGNAASFDLRQSAIDFGPGLRRFADLALVNVPGATLREGDQTFFRQGRSVDIIITIGEDFAAPVPAVSESDR